MKNSVAMPVIRQIKDTRDALDFFETVSLPAEDEKIQKIIMNFPTVYIHKRKHADACVGRKVSSRKRVPPYDKR